MRNLLLAVVGALIVVLLARWAVVHKQDSDANLAERQKMAALDPSAITHIELVRRGNPEPTVRFEKRADKWWLDSPEKYPASTYTIDAMVNSVGELKKVRTFAATPESVTKDTYGLTHPSYEIRLFGQGITRYVKLGEKNPVGDLWYAQTDTDAATTMHLVNTGFDAQLNKTIEDYRVREIFWDFPDSVTRMRIEFQGLVTDFTRNLSAEPASTATWYYSTSTMPSTSPAEKIQVDAVLNGLRNVSAAGFEPVAPRKIRQTLTVWGADTHSVSIGFEPTADSGYVAVVADRPFDYKIATYTVKPLFKPAERFVPDTTNPGALNEMLRENVKVLGKGEANDKAEE